MTDEIYWTIAARAHQFAPGFGGRGREVGAEAERRGVLYRVIGDTLAISPPLIVGEDEIDRIVAVLRDSIAEVCGQDCRAAPTASGDRP